MRTLRSLLKAHWGKIVCLLLGAGLVVGGSYYLRDQQRFAARAAHANGMVVRLTSSTHHDKHGTSTTYCPVVRFVTVREQSVEFTSGECSSPAPRVGASVKVLYDPDNPRHAKLDTTSARLTRWGFGGAMIIVGLLFGGGSIFGIARAVWRRPGRQRSHGDRDDTRAHGTDTSGTL